MVTSFLIEKQGQTWAHETKHQSSLNLNQKGIALQITVDSLMNTQIMPGFRELGVDKNKPSLNPI